MENPDLAAMTTHIYPLKLPDIVQLPAIRVNRVSENTDAVTLAHTTRVQFSCYAETYESAITLADAVRKALLNMTRVESGISILSITSAGGGIDAYESQLRRYHTSEDVSVVWRYTS